MYPTSIAEYAQYYQSLGFAIFPCHTIISGKCSCGNPKCNSPGKHPKTARGVKDASNDPRQIEEWFRNNNCNIGIATGVLSGVIVTDDDDIESNRQLTDLFPKTWIASTHEGRRHFYWRYDARCERLKNTSKFAGTQLDSRANGGYVIAPPSMHLSGNEYRWIVSPDDCDIADAPKWLLDLVPKHDEPKSVSTGKQDQLRVTSNNDSELLANAAHDAESSITVAVADDELTERARAYLAATPPAVSEERGGRRTYATVCNLVELFGGLDDSVLLELLEDWNKDCEPPWTNKELRHKLSDARKNTTDERRVDIQNNSIEVDDDNGLPVLSEDAFQGIIGEIVKAIEPETEADPSAVLVTLLTAIGNAIGRNPYFSVGGGRHHPNLFSAIVGDTASGKGQSMAIVRHIMSQCAPDWMVNIAEGLSSGEGLIERVADDEPEDGEIIVHQPLKPLMIVEEEFARPITAMRRESNTLSPILRSAWDGSPLSVMTRGKSKLRASNAYVSITAHVTPEELNRLMKDSVETSNGFANRFLWVYSTSSKLLPHGGNIDVLKPFMHRLETAINDARKISKMIRSEGADSLWESVYADLKRSRKGAYGRSTDRACPQVVRLSMIYALMDGTPTIEVHHLKAALAVWRYCDASARLLFDGNEVDPLEQKIIELLSANGPMSKTDIRQRLSSAARKTYVKVLDRLLDAGRLDFLDSQYVLKTVQSPKRPESPESPASTESNGRTATITELIDWRNEHGIEFTRNDEGTIWVSDGQTKFVMPAIERAIRANQETLTAFVPKVKSAEPKPEQVEPQQDKLTADELAELDVSIDDWDDDSKAFFAELADANLEDRVKANRQKTHQYFANHKATTMA
ncbi:MAG: bifunctional DNA primase/polymerase [Planctomycetaceae bacterium]|nr:bifunctional DNA primase/polymerase [Planctomycetaceae bacterium]MCB9949718.1 bifunctional DNA primase/polymerase [Planctomycetaceae bacterium]